MERPTLQVSRWFHHWILRVYEFDLIT
jgi:hypothetical protein